MMHVLSDIGLVCPMCIGGVSDMFLLVDFEGNGQRNDRHVFEECQVSDTCPSGTRHDIRSFQVSQTGRMEELRDLIS